MLSTYIPKSELIKYQHILNNESITNSIEQDFNDYISDHEINIHYDSGDINLDYLIETFHEYMSNY